METKVYSLPGFYEPFSAISHLFGAVLFFVLGCYLLRRGRGDWQRLFFLGVYVFATVFLMSMSGVYHMMVRGDVSHAVLIRLDHGAIFVLIAGTFTPVHGILFHGWKRWAPLFLIWSLAITGIALKTVFFEDMPQAVGLTMYLALGWLGLFSGILVAWDYGFAFIKPILWGGIAYSVGALIDFSNFFHIIPGVVYSHELFHIAVLLGALYQFQFVWWIAPGVHREVPRPTPQATEVEEPVRG